MLQISAIHLSVSVSLIPKKKPYRILKNIFNLEVSWLSQVSRYLIMSLNVIRTSDPGEEINQVVVNVVI